MNILNQTKPHPNSEINKTQYSSKNIVVISSLLVLSIAFGYYLFPALQSHFDHKSIILAGLTEIAVPSASSTEQHQALDAINKRPLIGSAKTVINTAAEPEFIFGGWAVRPQDNSLEGAIYGIIDSKYVIPTTYGLPRQDVATYLHTPKATNYGYAGICYSNMFSKGQHSFSLAIVNPDKTHYYLLNNLFHFDIL